MSFFDKKMKRFNDGYSGGQAKRSRMGPDDIEIRILIPSRVAGSIIGKGGSNIARLRSDFQAKVTVPDCPGPERILTVVSTFDNAISVIKDALQHLENVPNIRGKRPIKDENTSTDDVDLRLLVHQSQAGCIIGKGGGKVKELRENTGARIKIYSNCCPDSTDRVVQLTGAAEPAAKCLREILELIRTQAPIKGPESPYDPNNFDDYYSDEYGGYGSSGGGGAGQGFGGPRGGGPVGRGPPGRYGGGGPPPRGPMGPPRGGFRGGYGEDYDEVGDLDYDMPHGGRGLGNGAGGGGRNSTQVTIPKDLAGAIIGKAGNRIRKVRMESGAEITIDEPLLGSSDRIITISGTPNQIQMAQYLLQQCVHQNAKQGAGGGPGRRY